MVHIGRLTDAWRYDERPDVEQAGETGIPRMTGFRVPMICRSAALRKPPASRASLGHRTDPHHEACAPSEAAVSGSRLVMDAPCLLGCYRSFLAMLMPGVAAAVV